MPVSLAHRAPGAQPCWLAAAEFGLAVAAVRAWEQNLRTPDLAAQTLLRVIESYPDAVRRAVRAA